MLAHGTRGLRQARGRGCFHAIDFRELPRLSLPLPTVAINLGQVKLEHCIECKLCKLCNQSLAYSSGFYRSLLQDATTAGTKNKFPFSITVKME